MNYNNSSTKLLAIALLVLILWIRKSVSGSERRCRGNERSALLHIKAAVPFPIHSVNGKWEGQECCQWERVTCDPITRHVTGLDLSIGITPSVVQPSYRNLSIIEPWMSYRTGFVINLTMFLPLRQLRSLSLSGHGISGPSTLLSGFESWSNLTNLEMLDLSSNNLPESVLSSLAKISSLRQLYLDFNPMGGNISIKFKELIPLNLEVLSLYGCMFSGSIPYLGHWSSIQALSLGGNDLRGTLTSKGLCRLKNLKELDLSRNGFIGNLPLCMGNISSLKLVDLSHNQFEVKFPSFIFERLMSLRYLSLSNNQLEGHLYIRSFMNHSNLEVLRLSTLESLNLRVEVMNLPFQLQKLELANCILDVELTFLWSQYKLRFLDLSNTRSRGPVPAVWLLENNTNLIKLDLHKNLFTGSLQLPFLAHEKLQILDISDNHLSGELPAELTTNLPNIFFLNFSINYVQGPLPLISASNLRAIDLSFNNLTDDIYNSKILSYLPIFINLSNNKLYGSFPNNLNFSQQTALLLNDNNIRGEIPSYICNTSFHLLDFSNNELNGVLPHCIGRAEYSMLKLSGNNLEGSLPLDICAVQDLSLLDLSYNKFSGSIPPCSNQSALRFVNLSHNNLTGKFPVTWLNISNINAIDISENHLSGELPIWIEKDSNLIMLQVRGNMFGGPIPEEICLLKKLRILDLSQNNLHGEIPLCIIGMGSEHQYDFPIFGGTIMVSIGMGEMNFSDANFLLHFENSVIVGLVKTFNIGSKLVSKGRSDFYWKQNLEIQCVLDLSSNKLVGNIPENISEMNWLITLNLSNNHLSGAIPNSLSNLQQLESLDLSHNYLMGKIPRELTKLTSLESFSVAYNDLSGPTLGVEAQFSTFDNSSYEGNPNLCGPPLSKGCVPTLGTTPPSPIEMYEGPDFLIFFGSFSLFFVVSFWGFMVILYFKRNWRYALFTLVDWYMDMIYVKVFLPERNNGAA